MNKVSKGSSFAMLSIIATLVGTLAVAILLLFWMQTSSENHVFERTRAFSDVMRVVRPAILLVILLCWRQVFDRLLSRSMVTDRTRDRAMAIWPQLAIWVALFELMLGQGYVLLGLVALAGYLMLPRWQSE